MPLRDVKPQNEENPKLDKMIMKGVSIQSPQDDCCTKGRTGQKILPAFSYANTKIRLKAFNQILVLVVFLGRLY